jgi:hypothetical protein
MYRIELKHLVSFPRLTRFLTEKKALNGLITASDFTELYTVPVASLYDKSKFPSFTLTEICVLFSLRQHLLFLSQHFDVSAQLKRRHYRILRIAVENSEIDIFNFLVSLDSDNINLMISPYNYYLFRIAIRNQDVEMVERLLVLSGEHVIPMIAAHGYESLEKTIEEKSEVLQFLLLCYPPVFKFAMNSKKHQHIIPSFIDAFFRCLQDKKEQFFEVPHHIDVSVDILKFLVTQGRTPTPLTSNRITQLMSYDGVRNRIQTQR